MPGKTAKPQKGTAEAKRQLVSRGLTLKQYEAIMEKHREAYLAYERARNANRAGKLGKREADRIMDANREPHRIYWAAYELRRAEKNGRR
jgi:hypothetical protein